MHGRAERKWWGTERRNNPPQRVSIYRGDFTGEFGAARYHDFSRSRSVSVSEKEESAGRHYTTYHPYTLVEGHDASTRLPRHFAGGESNYIQTLPKRHTTPAARSLRLRWRVQSLGAAKLRGQSRSRAYACRRVRECSAALGRGSA
jgi:hypothetical protein